MSTGEKLFVTSEAEGGPMPPTFTLPQFGIFAQGTHAHHFLEFDLQAGVSPARAVSAFRQLRTPDVSAGGVNLVLAFGADAWRAVAPEQSPDDLTWFEPITERAERPGWRGLIVSRPTLIRADSSPCPEG